MKKKNKVVEVGVYTYSQHTRLSVNKARRVIDQIRGRSYDEALRILGLMPYRACEPILKLVSSAADNASHNMKISKTDLIISKAEVNRGTIRKKLKPRARGHSYPIKKTTCRITIVLKDVFEFRSKTIPYFKVKDLKKLQVLLYCNTRILSLLYISIFGCRSNIANSNYNN